MVRLSTRQLTFSKADIRKSDTDATTPPLQGRNKEHVPHRTDEDGNVVFDDEEKIENWERHGRTKALDQSLELDPDLDVDSYFVKGSTVPKVYSGELFSESNSSSKKLTKSQKKKKKKKLEKASKADSSSAVWEDSQDKTKSSARSSSPLNETRRPRHYIVDSGASFHLVDPRTLTKKERATIEIIDEPILVETANGEVTVTQRCRVFVLELHIEVWAYLHEDTVCVLSLGLLVDRNGFTYIWRPGKAPELKKGKFIVSSSPHFNVPFIYTSTARGLPVPDPKTVASYEKIVKDEMKGAEEFIPPPPKPFASEDVDSAGWESSRSRRRKSRG